MSELCWINIVTALTVWLYAVILSYVTRDTCSCNVSHVAASPAGGLNSLLSHGKMTQTCQMSYPNFLWKIFYVWIFLPPVNIHFILEVCRSLTCIKLDGQNCFKDRRFKFHHPRYWVRWREHAQNLAKSQLFKVHQSGQFSSQCLFFARENFVDWSLQVNPS